MKKLFLLVVLMAVNCSHTAQGDSIGNESLFATVGLEKVNFVQVIRYDSLISEEHHIERSITDEDTIELLLGILKLLPGEGELMVEFSEGAEYLQVVFSGPDGDDLTIEIIGGKIKTPATSFYADDRDDEKMFIEIITGK